MSIIRGRVFSCIAFLSTLVVLFTLIPAKLYSNAVNAGGNVADTDMVIHVDFEKYIGGTWTLDKYSSLSALKMNINDPDDARAYWYTIEFNNGSTVEVGSATDPKTKESYIVSFASGDPDLVGATSADLTVHGLGANAFVSVQRPECRGLSHLVAEGTVLNALADGESVDHNDDYIIPFAGGTTHNVTAVSPVVYDGTVSFDSFDGSLSGYEYNFTFKLSNNSSDNVLIDDFYWTIDGDSTRHVPTKTNYYAYSQDNTYYVEIPIGRTVTFHNLPYNVMFHEGIGIPASTGNYRSADSYSNPDHANVNSLTHEGQNISPNSSLDDTEYRLRGIDMEMFYVLTQGQPADCVANDIHNSNPTLNTSGVFYQFGLGNGFEVKTYIMRRPVQFMFSKTYGTGDQYGEPGKKHHFKIQLTDTLTNMPFTGRVAYYIYDSLDDTLNEDTDVNYAAPDASGIVDIYVEAGQYVRVGRSVTQSLINEMGLALRTGAGTYPITDASRLNEDYIPGSGMLPYGISYSITEVEDGYTCSNTGAAAATVTDTRNLNTSGLTGRQILTFMQNGNVTPPVFTNTRQTGSLQISKVLSGDSDKDEFSFVLTINDDGSSFPASLTYTSSKGGNGTISLTAGATNGTTVTYTGSFTMSAGEQITIADLPVGARYEITETSGSSAGFEVTYTNCSGTIVNGVTSALVTNTVKPPETTPSETTPGDKYVPATGEDTSGYTIAGITVVAAAVAVFITRRRLINADAKE